MDNIKLYEINPGYVKIRLLAFDLDGTAITEHKFLSPGNREALVKAGEAGALLVPATGRMRGFLPEEIVNLPGVRYAITSNGAAVYDLKTGNTLLQNLIPAGKAEEVRRLLEGYDLYIEYYREGRAITKQGFPEIAFTHFGMPESKRYFVEGKAYSFVDDFRELTEEGLCPEKINLPYLPEGVRRELWGKLTALGGLRLTSSLAGNIEINAENAHKGAALLALGERLGISSGEMFAIGDNGNDVTMLRAAGCSAAVADGAPDALAAAKYITAAHDEDGLAKAIWDYVLRGKRA